MHPISMFTPEQRVALRRLEAAWLQGSFDEASQVLEAIGARRPEGAWAPRPADLPTPRLRHMHEVWAAHHARRPAGNDLPHVSQCRIEDYGDAAEVMMVLRFWPDRSDLDYLHYGAELARHAGGSQAGLTVGRLAHHAPYSLVFPSSYYAAASARSPHYSEMVSAPTLVSTTWCRYLLPYVDDEGRVAAFACGNVPVPGVRTWPLVRDGRLAAQPDRPPAPAPTLPDLATEAALAKLERDVRALLECSPLATMIISVGTGRCYFTNAPLDRLLEFEHEALNLADPFSHFSDPAQYHHALAEAREGRAVRDVEVGLTSRNGRTLWALLSAMPIDFDSHACVALWFYDITARKAAQEALQRALAQAEHARAELTRTLAYVGHDLRAPLATITGYARLLANGVNDVQQPLVDVISRSAQYQMGLIDELLEFARGELLPLQLNPKPIGLAQALEDIADFALILTAQQRNRFRYVRSPWLPAVVMQDRQRLQQVLLNLIANAAKFTHDGDIELRVQAEALDAQRCRLDIRVSDSGIGIGEADQARIFEAFEQVQGEARGSVGLGLFIVRRILQLMGSAMTLESRIGAGSSFSFSLEMQIVQADVPETAPPAWEASTPSVLLAASPKKQVREKHSALPPESARRVLEELASQGRLSDLEDWVAQARSLHPGCEPFIAEVARALADLDFDAILKMARAPSLEGALPGPGPAL